MPASYPTSAKTFTTKNDGAGNTIQAAHVNDLQLEVTAIETDLLAGLPVARGGTGNVTLTANRVLLGNGTSAVAVAGAGTSGQVLTSNGASAPTFQDATAGFARGLTCGRLSLTSGTAVTVSDVTAATTLYYALYQGNQVGLYTGSAWQAFTIAELSIAVPATTNQMYDVFVDYNAGTPALSLTAWTNDTTRATALTTQDGVLVLTGSTGKRFVGCMRTTGVSGQTEDSFAKRFVWNAYHRQLRAMRVTDATNSWNYTTNSFQQANASTANQVAFVIGLAEVEFIASVTGYALNSGGSLEYAVAIGVDSATTPTANQIGMYQFNASSVAPLQVRAELRTYPAVGYHFAAWLERSVTTTGTTAWYGDNNTTYLQSGLHGVILG